MFATLPTDTDARSRDAPSRSAEALIPEARGTLVVVGAGARVGKTSMVHAFAALAQARGRSVVNVGADLGVRSVAEHGVRMRERMLALKDTADLVIVDCAGEREALLLAPAADVVILVTHAAARPLQDAAHRIRQLLAAGVPRLHVVVNMAASAEAGRVAFSLLLGTVPSASDRLVLAAVVAAPQRRAEPQHRGPATRARGEGPSWRDAALLILDGAHAPQEAAPAVAPTVWQRIKRAFGVSQEAASAGAA